MRCFPPSSFSPIFLLPLRGFVSDPRICFRFVICFLSLFCFRFFLFFFASFFFSFLWFFLFFSFFFATSVSCICFRPCIYFYLRVCFFLFSLLYPSTFLLLLWPGRGSASATRSACFRAICSRAVRNRPFHLRLFIRSSFSFPYEVVKVHGGLSHSFPFHFLRFICGFLCCLFSGSYMLPIKPFSTYLTPFCGDDICCGG